MSYGTVETRCCVNQHSGLVGFIKMSYCTVSATGTPVTLPLLPLLSWVSSCLYKHVQIFTLF
jgi:hypothetical protein